MTTDRVRTALLWMLGLITIAQGINHFVNLDFFLRMMPPYLPAHRFLVELSGVIEVLIGAALLHPRTRVGAAWAYLALLVAVYPANFQMLLHPEDWPEIPPIAHWIRMPFQFVFAAWVWWTCLGEGAREQRAAGLTGG